MDSAKTALSVTGFSRALKVIPWLKAQKRVRIVFWAVLLGAICGFIEFGQPAEDGLRALRNHILERRADQSIVVVALDDRTLNTLRASTPLRSDDAKIVDKIFALGAKRVFFDKAFADQTSPTEDVQLQQAFKRHQGKIFIGGFVDSDQQSGQEDTWPLAMFRQAANIRIMSGITGPFGLSIQFPIVSKVYSGSFPSISAELAHAALFKDNTYRPNFAIDPTTIPTVSYIDLLRGRAHATIFRRHDVIVGQTSKLFHDLHWVPFHGEIAGVYFHVVGAQTLKEGLPKDIGWLPAFFLAACLLIALVQFPSMRAPRMTAYAVVATTTLWLVAPYLSLSVDIVPGLLTVVLGGVRLGLDARRKTNTISGLPTIASLRSASIIPGDHVFALRINNYASIKASFIKNIEAPLIAEIARRITMSEGSRAIAHDQDTLVWTRPAIALEDLRDHARGLHAMIGKGLSIDGSLVDVAVSFGIDVNYAEPLAARIDEAMQSAEDAVIATHICKVGGVSTATERAWNVQILSQLEQAMTNGELWVAYQPKVSLRTRETTGVEALIRWTHPERGLIGPSEFIPVAERHNRMEPLTAFVIDQAIHTLSTLDPLRPGFKMAINISTQMLWSDRIVQLLEHAVKKHKVKRKQVVLEITETAQVATDDEALSILTKLKARGYQISIDDFGTGNATMDYLAKIPADEVKIDRTFVANIEKEGSVLAQSVIDIARSTGKRVVAEGIETLAIARLLKKMGCDEGQGFLFDKAMPAADLHRRLEGKPASRTA